MNNNFCFQLLAAIDDEMKAENFYTKLKNMTDNETAQKLFDDIIQSETEHTGRLTKVFMDLCTKSS
jgi:rubrerythrin